MTRTTNTVFPRPEQGAMPKLLLLILGLMLMAVVIGCGTSSENEPVAPQAPAAPAPAAPAAALAPQSPASPAQPRPASVAPAAAPSAPMAAPAPAPAPTSAPMAAPAPVPAPTSAPATAMMDSSKQQSVPVQVEAAMPASAPTVAPAATAPAAVQAAPAAALQSGGGPPMHPGVPPQDRRWSRHQYQQTPSATTFEDYQRSRFVWTEDDAVSTFSLDTDRTSYQLALNWARSGYEIDPDSVRAEEWINSFDYGYDMPANRDSFAMSTDVMKHPLQERTYLVRLGFQAPRAAR